MSDEMDALGTSLAEGVRLRAGQLLRGSAESVQRYAAAIAVDMAYAASTDDAEMARHLRAQARALAEAERLEVAGASWEQLSELIYGLTEGARIALAL